MKKNIYNLFILTLIVATNAIDISGQICPVPEVNLGNDTLICPGESIFLDAGDHPETTTILWNEGTIGRYLLVSQPGTYFVNVTNECEKSASDTIKIGLAELPEVNLSYPKKEYYCKGEIVDLNAEVMSVQDGLIYEWVDKNSTEPTLNVDTTGTYTLRVINEYGCKIIREVNLEFQYPYEEEKILLTTFDPSEGKNIIIWSRTPEKRTQSFLIFAGNSENDLLAEANYQNVNLYVDQNSDPATAPSLYNFQVLDSCQNRSVFRPEKAHRTMHLNAFTDANGNATLEWTPYLGFEYVQYYIYKGTEPDMLILSDSVQYDPKADRMSYIDKNAREGVLYYYDIRVKTPTVIYLDNPDRKKAGSGPFVHSLSNLEDNMIRTASMSELEIMEQYFKVYPNPARDKINISYLNENGRNIHFVIYDITGTEVARFTNDNLPPGNFERTFQPEDHGLNKGIYILKMNVENLGSLTKKVIKY